MPLSEDVGVTEAETGTPDRLRTGLVVPPELGDVLRAARQRAGLSVRELAAQLGVSPSTVVDAERHRDVRLSTLRSYVSTLPGLSPQLLLGRGPGPRPVRSDAAWAYLRGVFAFTARLLRLEIDVEAAGRRVTRWTVEGVRSLGGDLRDPAIRTGIMQVVSRGSAEARRRTVAGERDLALGVVDIRDGCFRHEFRFPRLLNRSGLTYTRIQIADEEPPPGVPPPGRLPVSAPFASGASVAVEHPVERVELVVRFPTGGLPATARACAWTDVQALAADEPDLAPFLHPEGLRVSRAPRDSTLRLRLERPLTPLQYGIAWGDGPERAAEAPTPVGPSALGAAGALRAAREEAGLSRRELARRLGVSPVTITAGERGQDLRRSHLIGLLDALPSLRPEELLPPARELPVTDRREAWEYYRLLFGIEADEERKTLVVTPRGDALAVCETLRLRRVRAADADLRVRYGSAPASHRRWPTELREIEEAIAAEVEDAGLRARIVSRTESRLIHEITVPRHLAQVGVSYSRRLFTPHFFDPGAARDADREPEHDGAAIVPFHPVRRLVLTVRLPAGAWTDRTWFGVHPRMMLAEPSVEADVAERLHPEGLTMVRCDRTRSLSLAVDYPLVGFMYDVFWQRPA